MANRHYHIKSRERVVSHGEVFTPPWLVEAMLDLVKEEVERIDSRILEPACGNGNFLMQILRRKLAVVELKYGKSDFERRHHALLALMCIYGIELLADNVAECRANLLEIFAEYLDVDTSHKLYHTASRIISQNIIHGDTLAMRTHDGHVITFAEWNYLGDGRYLRRDFRLDTLTTSSLLNTGESLFTNLEKHRLFTPAKTYPPMTVEELAEAEPGVWQYAGDDVTMMQFDVIIGNPPYHKRDGGFGPSAIPIYHLFIEKAKQLAPKYIVMVVPSRWFTGGKGLDAFRKEMLSSHKLAKLVDYPVSKEVFPDVEIKGGICYFLWSQVHDGPCEVTVVRGKEKTTALRQLDEFDVFVRDPIAVDILRKVLKTGERSITDILTARNPFGIESNFEGFHARKEPGDIALYYIRHGKRGIGYIPENMVTKNVHLINGWKVLVPAKASDGGQRIPDTVLGKPWIVPPPSAATDSFLAFLVKNEKEANSLTSYYRTKFFRFLVSLRKLTQNASRSVYNWVPMQTWDRQWTDAELYARYDLTPEEIAYIESVISPMEANGENSK